GYFLLRSNPGGLMIQPSTRAPPVEAYHTVSVDPSRMRPRTSSFTFVSRVTGARAAFKLNRAMSGGFAASERTPTPVRSRAIDDSDSIWSPSVTLRLPPRRPAKYTLLVPCSASAKNTPLPSGLHRTALGSRSWLVRDRIAVPSMPALQTSYAR